MKPPRSFLWHDYETFGANPRLDRPADPAGRERRPEERPTFDKWLPDSSQQAASVDLKVKAGDKVFDIHVVAPEGRPTLRVAYFFSGISRKCSVGECLRALCIAGNFGLELHEVDI